MFLYCLEDPFWPLALIDVKKGKLTLRFREEEVKFNLNQSLKQHDNEEVHCMRIEEFFAEKMKRVKLKQ